MLEALAILSVILLVALGVLVAILLARVPRVDLSGLDGRLRAIEAGQERADRTLRDEMGRARAESAGGAKELREEVLGALTQLGELLSGSMARVSDVQRDGLEAFAQRLAALSESNERRLEALRVSVEERLRALQEDNASHLEKVRVTVDERLQGTLEARLGESFRSVSERLEQVHRGLGEMQALASGVGDLKRVLTNVKTRGTWGEVQLGALLEQVLAPGQYGTNVATKEGSTERVEFAIRLPGRDEADGTVWLPLDAKFPQEDYQRLLDASERGDADGVETASRQLEQRVKASAHDIHTKYLDPPHTTDFAILFLPTEGLYAEVLRRPGLADGLQRDERVVVAGPTTVWAILNSLQMGFRSLAIERSSSEVWRVLGAVKTQFGRFGDLLGGVQKKLQEASNKMDAVARQSRTIERKLRDVQELPAGQSPDLFRLEAPDPEAPDAEARDADALDAEDTEYQAT
jgi:DNA recombination protein RmuC